MLCLFHLKKNPKMGTKRFFAFRGLFLMPCEEASLELQQPPVTTRALAQSKHQCAEGGRAERWEELTLIADRSYELAKAGIVLYLDMLHEMLKLVEAYQSPTLSKFVLLASESTLFVHGSGLFPSLQEGRGVILLRALFLTNFSPGQHGTEVQ